MENYTYCICLMGIFFFCNSDSIPGSSDGNKKSNDSPFFLYLYNIKIKNTYHLLIETTV